MIKTVSLDTAKKLKEVGFKQNSALYWFAFGHGVREWQITDRILDNKSIKGWRNFENNNRETVMYAAPTSDEILEELPCNIKKERRIYWLKIKKDKEGFLIYYVDDYGGDEMDELAVFQEVILCESLAAMWLYLKQQGLLPTDKPKQGKEGI